MKHVPLTNFLDGRTQQEVADFMGCSQSNVAQMLKANREVYIVASAKGDEPRWFEIKKPKKSRQASTAA